MKFHAIVTSLSFIAIIACTSPLSAGDISPKSIKKDLKVKPQERPIAISQDLTIDNSYVMGADAKVGNQKFGSTTELNNHVNYVISPQLKDNLLLRVGFDYERYSFGLPSTEHAKGFYLPTPNSLQSTAMVIGADITINDQWLMRVEATPGVYSDTQDLSTDDVNVPFIIGASYLINKDLQWFFGASVNLWRSIPVIPGVGVRWKFDDEWTLFLVLPDPQIQYELNEHLTLFAGAHLKGETYRMGESFGHDVGRNKLNSSIVEYTEIRTGAGLTWEALSNLSVTLEGGYVPYRNFDYSRANTRAKIEAAPYVELSGTAKF